MPDGTNLPPRNYPEAYGFLAGTVETAIARLEGGSCTPGEVAAMLREYYTRAERMKEGTDNG